MRHNDPNALVRTYKRRDAITVARGRTELLIRHLAAPSPNLARLRADADAVLACIIHLEAILAQSDGEATDRDGHAAGDIIISP